MKWVGILPMAGKGSRLGPLPFSKELYPVAHKSRHFAVSEFSVRAMMRAKVDEIKIVIRPDKLDIVKYYAGMKAPLAFHVHHPSVPYSLPESSLYPIDGLDDDDACLFGLPDTLFSPSDGYIGLKKELQAGADLCLGMFRVKDASRFDSVKFDRRGNVLGVVVKKSPPLSNWIWGIWGARVKTLRLLKKRIGEQKRKKEKLLGVGFNDLLSKGNLKIKCIKVGSNYFDVGNMEAVVRINDVMKKFEI